MDPKSLGVIGTKITIYNATVGNCDIDLFPTLPLPILKFPNFEPGQARLKFHNNFWNCQNRNWMWMKSEYYTVKFC